MKISVLQLAEFIAWVPAAYYYEGTPRAAADELWGELLNSVGDKWVAVDPARMINPKVYMGSAYFGCNKEGVDPLNLNGQSVMPVFEKWLADQTSKVVAFRIPNDKLEGVLAHLKELGIEPV
jgi:hypothetical protein